MLGSSFGHRSLQSLPRGFLTAPRCDGLLLATAARVEWRGQGINLYRQNFRPWQRTVQRSGGAMQQLGTATKSVPHGLAIGKSDRGQLGRHVFGDEERLNLVFLMRLRHAVFSWRSSWPAARAVHAFGLSYTFTSFAALGS
ncbi:MAG: hypothetical protein WAV22_13295 [Porticoccaceae bacterium]